MWIRGSWGWSSFSLDSSMVFASVSHLAPWRNERTYLICQTFNSLYLHVQTMDINPLLRRVGEGVPAGYVGDVGDETHLVQGQLVLPRRALHYCRQEALGVEETGEPDWGWEDELICPCLLNILKFKTCHLCNFAKHIVQLLCCYIVLLYFLNSFSK